ncbi:MAG: hypothetical protein HYU36_22225 [Planctomycetes bacterium]|nr:hypothetical protein [Planctomycetota bacterium]
MDKFGNPISVTKNVTGSQSFESDVDVVGVDSITASVPDGQYLCKNQGELITLTADPKPSGSAFPSGQPVWTTTAGGSFAGSTTGTTVQWQQADGFVSAEADDVVIRATCGTSVVEFKLTVFHVKSTSGVLGTNETKEFPSEWQPADADLDFMIDLMNSTAFEVRQFDVAPPLMTLQPKLTDVIREVEFFKNNVKGAKQPSST